MGVIEREDNLEELKESYYNNLHICLETLKDSEKRKNKQKLLNDTHASAVKYFNAFERTLDEYSLDEIEISADVINRKIEDTINIIDVICKHWEVILRFSEKYNLVAPKPSSTAYASIQRVIKRFDKKSVKTLKNKFVESGLPVYGFEDKKKHSGWVKNKFIINTQIIIGIILLVIAGGLIFVFPNLTEMQYMFVRVLSSLGIVLTGVTLIEGSINVNWSLQKSLVIKASGWIAIFILLYYVNPPVAPPINEEKGSQNTMITQ